MVRAHHEDFTLTGKLITSCIDPGLMYVVWAGIVALGVLCIFIVSKKGKQWRLDAEMCEAEISKAFDEASPPK